MDGILYNIIFSESKKTIRFESDENPLKMDREAGEQLVAQVEGSEDARHIVRLVETLRPDLEVDDKAVEGGY